MTKKDFILIANVLRINRGRWKRPKRVILDVVIDDMAAEFARTCPRFDRQKFIEACQ